LALPMSLSSSKDSTLMPSAFTLCIHEHGTRQNNSQDTVRGAYGSRCMCCMRRLASLRTGCCRAGAGQPCPCRLPGQISAHAPTHCKLAVVCHCILQRSQRGQQCLD
jgi:hypothetical protein